MSGNLTLIRPQRFGDDRGWFSEVYSEGKFQSLGILDRFVQDNHSMSRPIGTVRGLHYQAPPHAQAKLVRCIRGRIFDVAVDIRKGSETYGHWIGAELSAENGLQLYIPVGYAHGFVTLETSSEITYKVSDIYAPMCDGGIRWDDPAIGIDWPLPKGFKPTLSSKDEKQPLLSDFDSPFEYDGRPMKLVEV